MANDISALVARSRAAQAQIADYTQEQADAVVKVLAKAVYDNAEPLAKLAVEETRMGVYEDKVQKNKGKARIIWNGLKGKKSVGIIENLEDEGVAIVAKPMGVVGAVTPCTNPVVTPMCNAMFALKGRNSIVVASHPRGRRCVEEIARLYYKELDRMGVPRDVFLYIEEPSVEATNALMRESDVVIATGGMNMVKAAYSSGKPSFGVGAGNVQGIVGEDADIPASVKRMVQSRVFDNGIICSGTQTVIAPRGKYAEIIAEFVRQGAYYTEDPVQADAFRRAAFPGGAFNRDAVGQPASKLAELAGVGVPDGTRLIIVKPEKYGEGELFSQEKMCPLMSSYEYGDWGEAVEIARQNLMVEGAGHSVDLQTCDRANIEYAGLKLPVSRVLVNQICATMNGGAFANSLSPTTTLGCGSWGNNSISENLSYFHLINKSRIVVEKKGWRQPPDDEIWA